MSYIPRSPDDLVKPYRKPHSLKPKNTWLDYYYAIITYGLFTVFVLVGVAILYSLFSLRREPQPSPRPTTILLPREPAVLCLMSPVDDDQIDTATLAGLHKAGMLGYRRAVEEELTMIQKGRTE